MPMQPIKMKIGPWSEWNGGVRTRTYTYGGRQAVERHNGKYYVVQIGDAESEPLDRVWQVVRYIRDAFGMNSTEVPEDPKAAPAPYAEEPPTRGGQATSKNADAREHCHQNRRYRKVTTRRERRNTRRMAR